MYTSVNRKAATDALYDFIKKYQSIYPKAIDVLNDLDVLFTFYAFPKKIQRSIYTTNLIENFNKNLKRGTKLKEQFPNENSLERYVCTFCMDYNKRFNEHVHRGFKESRSELLEMFDKL